MIVIGRGNPTFVFLFGGLSDLWVTVPNLKSPLARRAYLCWQELKIIVNRRGESALPCLPKTLLIHSYLYVLVATGIKKKKIESDLYKGIRSRVSRWVGFLRSTSMLVAFIFHLFFYSTRCDWAPCTSRIWEGPNPFSGGGGSKPFFKIKTMTFVPILFRFAFGLSTTRGGLRAGWMTGIRCRKRCWGLMVAEGLACDPKGVRAYLLLLILNFFFLIYKCSREREREEGWYPPIFLTFQTHSCPFCVRLQKNQYKDIEKEG